MSRLPRTLTPVPQVPRLTTEAYNDGIRRTAARAAYTVDSSCAASVVPGKPVEYVRSTSTYGAYDHMTYLLNRYDLSRNNVTELPFDLDTSQATDLSGMFEGFRFLTTVPALDTSGVTNMNSMFRGCLSLTSVPEMDASQAVDMTSMFHGCSSLTAVPDLNTPQAVDMTSMFAECSSLTTAPALDTSQATVLAIMFASCTSLTAVPDLNTSQATSLVGMFLSCTLLTDGNVRLIGKHPDAETEMMIIGSGLTREPFFDEQGNPI